jgi:hypothetical protein
VSREIGFAPRCTELRSFAAKNSPTVEATVKSEFPSRARVELFNPRIARQRRQNQIIWTPGPAGFICIVSILTLNGSAVNLATPFFFLPRPL